MPSNAVQVRPYLDFLVGAEAETLLTELGIVAIDPIAEARSR